MVADFDEGQMLGELQELEEEIEAVETGMGYYNCYCPIDEARIKNNIIFANLLNRLGQDKEHIESRLRIHRQKVEESGVKY